MTGDRNADGPRQAEFEHIRSGFISKESDRVRVYATMQHRMSLAELAALLDEHTASDARINFGTVEWERDATEQEITDRAARISISDRRREQWERETLVRLVDKYGTLS